MTSLDMVRHLYRRGVFAKQAALDVMHVREGLLKRALAKEADRFCTNVLALTKEASIFDGLGRAPKAAAKAEGLFAKFRHGGPTPAKEPASWSDVGANLAKMLGIAGLSAAATAGGSALLKHRRDGRLQQDIEHSYKKMFEEFPRLAEVDPGKVRSRFDVLAKFAPSVAAEPIVAGTYLSRTVHDDVLDPAAIKGLAETQRRIDEMHENRSPFSQHFDRGLNVAHKAMNPFSKDKPV
jgi:hypothetical protein